MHRYNIPSSAAPGPRRASWPRPSRRLAPFSERLAEYGWKPLDIHQRGVQSEGGAVDGGSII